mmetsp:Transcript_119089/g.370987  ORF Transcript_119089/g.370987 Transcript_119089/m.370987 type:complete len:482 (+) Transcript_119089:298-1743(+)
MRWLPLAIAVAARLLQPGIGLRLAGTAASSAASGQHKTDSSQIPLEGAGGLQGFDNRVEMWNFEDMQYFTHIKVGGQEITGIIDTGSFELVVFERHCNGCGLAGKYNKMISRTSSVGPLEQRLYYGSGDIFVRQAFDLVSLGSFSMINQTFWQGDDAHMPVLEYAKFQSIIGVGPPETPANDFWAKTSEAIGRVRKSLSAGTIPTRTSTRKVMDHLQASMEMSQHRTLLSQYHVGAFSLCLGKLPGSSGFFVWNDTSPFQFPALFKHVRVIGRHTWTVNLTDVHLSSGTSSVASLGCSQGCGAVIDSGTSLLMMPSEVVDLLERHVMHLHADCRNIHTLPEFAFHLDGHRFTLPPDAYLAELEGTQAFDEGDQRARIRNLRLGAHCQLTVMESYSDTHWGPLWIIGMPFFRKYYTSFVVGRSHEDRALFVAPASAGCTPSSPAMALADDRPQEFTHRRFNVSHMFMPPLVRQATTAGFVHL